MAYTPYMSDTFLRYFQAILYTFAPCIAMQRAAAGRFIRCTDDTR